VLRVPAVRARVADRAVLLRAWVLRVPAVPWDRGPLHLWARAVRRAVSVHLDRLGLADLKRVGRIVHPPAKSKDGANDPRRRSRPGPSPRSASGATGIGVESSTTTSPLQGVVQRGDVT
jgi:hypothetical protein